MREIEKMIKERCETLFQEGMITRLIGWKKGLFDYDPTPHVFTKEEGLHEFVYNEYCGANLSKYLIQECPTTRKVTRLGVETKSDEKTGILLKPCDSYSFNQLLSEHRFDQTRVYAIGIGCSGKHREEENGELLERCTCCKGKEHVAYDELIGAELSKDTKSEDRFAMVKQLEAMSSEERFAFWRNELSKCIRCNACRNVCPACSCIKCVFDNPDSKVADKVNADPFQENLYHIIRSFHVAGRCSDCGECTRVCPQHIPLHLLNRKYIMEMNELYGTYQAGASVDARNPLVDFKEEDDEPSIILRKAGNI